MKVELQASLMAHEQRINERNAERRNDQALQAHVAMKKKGEKWKGKKHKGKMSRNKTEGAVNFKNQDHAESLSQANKNYHLKKKNWDKSKIHCFNCNKFCHFASECYQKKNVQK